MTTPGRRRVHAPGEGTSSQIGADRFVRKGAPEEGTNAFCIVEYEGAPGMQGPPPHVHRNFDEARYILEGAAEFHAEWRIVRAWAGSYLHVPRGVAHPFPVGTAPARSLGIFSPGRSVGLIEGLGALIPDEGAPDPAKVTALFAKYDTEIVRTG